MLMYCELEVKIWSSCTFETVLLNFTNELKAYIKILRVQDWYIYRYFVFMLSYSF